MISRLTLLAAVFATLAAGSMAYATSTVEAARPAAAAHAVRIVELPRVTVTAKRLPAAEAKR